MAQTYLNEISDEEVVPLREAGIHNDMRVHVSVNS